MKIPRYDYADQKEIDPYRVRLLAAFEAHYNLYFGLVLQCISGERLANLRDADAIITAVQDLISDEDIVHTRRILDRGCPAKFKWE